MTKKNPAAITDEQIEALRMEAGEAGDQVQVALCDLALATCLPDEVPASVDWEGVRSRLEELGVYAENIDRGAATRARAICERTIRDAQAQQD